MIAEGDKITHMMNEIAELMDGADISISGALTVFTMMLAESVVEYGIDAETACFQLRSSISAFQEDKTRVSTLN